MDGNEKRILTLAASLLLVFFMGLGWAYRSYGVSIPSCVSDVRPFPKGQLIQRGEHDFEVQMVARMWKFEPEEVTLPPGSKVALYLASGDVVHGLQIAGTNVNLMAIPGTVNYAEVTFDREGEYPMICHEYCGRNHQSMNGKFVIKSGALVSPAPSGLVEAPKALGLSGAAPSLVKLFDSHDCLACHTLDGTAVEDAPTFLGLFGSRRKLTNGKTVVADEAYLRRAIVDPESEVVEGYEAMPSVDPIPEADLRALIESLEKLGGHGRP